MDFEGCYASGLVNTEDWSQFPYGLGLGSLAEMAIVQLHHAGVAVPQFPQFPAIPGLSLATRDPPGWLHGMA